ncbi:MAG: fumarylacetoacetate hydrolase family protein [Paraburkholderia sp.]|jgi:2-keto-4-pentenoate hydratase/2-oxohepta-3-ene-1,7-dioic acid hydratase in catechol pathway|nr:fumarylacetoacetate hydrolase family protein [Paraburkholderia sp.]
MKLVSFEQGGRERIGSLHEGVITDLTEGLAGRPLTMIDLLGMGENGLEMAARAETRKLPRIALNEVNLLAPVPRPGKYLGVGGNFESHLQEAAHLGLKRPQFPIWFNKQTTCVTGPFAPIHLPRVSAQLDYECELGIVIGRRCRHVRIEEALDVVAGYVVCNDVSVRDWQLRSPTATLGKSFDTHGPFGPWLVTKDEVADPQALRIRTWVNGELRQDGSTSEMLFSCAALIADLSQVCTLEPGDVLATGSPSGCGGLRNPPAYLRSGDVVRMEIQRVGVIENSVIDEPVRAQ